ncbi:cache domain-containing protein [Burkholderiaceae bacterium UC74_6]
MRLKAKLLVLAAIPLLLALLAIAVALQQQQRELGRAQKALVDEEYMSARRSELKHYLELGRSAIQPLYDSGRDDEAARNEAVRVLGQLDYGDDGYFFVYDFEGHVLMHSRQRDLVGQNLWELRDPQGRATIQRLIAQARQGGGYVEYPWRKPSTGTIEPKLSYVVALPRWRWMIGTGLYLDDIQAAEAQLDRQTASNIRKTMLWLACMAGGGLGLITISGLWLNLNEHRVADAKLKLLAQQLVRSQEDERAHLARELHDGTSQTLVAAKLLIESALDQMESEGEAPQELLCRTLERLNELLVEVRRISHSLRPAMLDTLGLPAALRMLASEADGRMARSVDFSIVGDAVELPESVNTALFRVAQEALANAAKHARAAHISLRLRYARRLVVLEIEDDGQGFDLTAVLKDSQRGIGLRNMRERLESIDGDFKVTTAVGRGTLLMAKVPTAAFEKAQQVL